ncbi:MAG: UDP-N-acetylglucosamine 2-epimerase (non-hydrolyzing) [Bacteriovoracaceae bacterium]|jgi:UDP-N-acetylglucosamine 2-epimerase (non-hydrolysing)|nr:UDP-N-acetylglucosamine 2-epimerase (non-hydrolyzing) [Bacteriovoracaceae bacterium]
MKKIFVVIGTRPEIIKMSPVLPFMEEKFKLEILYTGQHYSKILSEKIFEDLQLKIPKYYLNSKSTNSSTQLGDMIKKISKILVEELPSAVVVHGDTNTTLAGALAANKLNIPVVHIESGARSGNKNEPEELNRILVDQIAFINFPFDANSKHSLLKENIRKNIFLLPNTAREAVKRNIKIAKQKSQILKRYQLEGTKYVLSTLHRATNTNNPTVLKKYILLIEKVSQQYKVLIPMHPRTKKLLKMHDLSLPKNVKVIPPVGYLDFLILMQKAFYIISDSGGVVDESLVLNTPLFIFRNETERDDVISLGKAALVKPSWGKNALFKFIKTKMSDEEIKRMKDIRGSFKILASKKMSQIIYKMIK